MNILDPGHSYELANHEPNEPGDQNQSLKFIKKVDSIYGFITVQNGTTNEEVLKVLIDRLQHLQAKLPCRENAIVLTHLETALLWLEARTKNRQARGVENTPNP